MKSNHFGNVIATISDLRLVTQNTQNEIVYEPLIKSLEDYYPFGQKINAFSLNSENYRYGFNAKEKDENGEFGNLTHYDYGFRIYNPSIGRFLSVDPLSWEYPFYTPYQFAGNMPIWALDLDGLEPIVYNHRIIAYKVKYGQGPKAIADDINNALTQKQHKYSLSAPFTWLDVIINPKNSHYFDHITENKYDVDNKAYYDLNMNTFDIIHVESFITPQVISAQFRIDLNDKRRLLPSTLKLMKNFGFEQRQSGAYLKSKEFFIDEFLNNIPVKSNQMLDYFDNTDGSFSGMQYVSKRITDEITITFQVGSDSKISRFVESSWEENKLFLLGEKDSAGGETRLVTIDFGDDNNSFEAAKDFLKSNKGNKE